MPERRVRGSILWLALLLGFAFLAGCEPRLSQPPPISVEEPVLIGPVNVARLGAARAAEALRAELSFLIEGDVTLAAGDARLVASSASELGIEPVLDASVRRALGEESGEELGKDEVFAGSLVWRVDRKVLRERLVELAAKVYRPPENAEVSVEDGSVSPGRAGRVLDLAEAEERVLAWLQRWEASETEVRLPVRAVPPAVGADELSELAKGDDRFGRTLLTGYTTYYDESLEGRSANVRLAAALIDGTVLRPGEVFSFNETVGPRLLERGFRPAPEIVGEEFVEGVGGGICQVSSTLFNAALYADLKIVERYRHSVPLGYVPPGRDATLQYGVMDFRFQNTLDEPIVIRTEAGDGRLRVSLWGSKPLPYDVRLFAEHVEVPYREVIELDPALGAGESRVDEEGAPGKWIIVSKAIRDKESGVESPPEVVSRNYYPPRLRRVRVGPDPRFWTANERG